MIRRNPNAIRKHLFYTISERIARILLLLQSSSASSSTFLDNPLHPAERKKRRRAGQTRIHNNTATLLEKHVSDGILQFPPFSSFFFSFSFPSSFILPFIPPLVIVRMELSGKNHHVEDEVHVGWAIARVQEKKKQRADRGQTSSRPQAGQRGARTIHLPAEMRGQMER